MRESGGIRLVAVDMDGTILERGREVKAELREALLGLAARGVRVTTATGRPVRFQLEILPANGLGPAVGTPQALIVDERELFLLDEAGGRYEPHAPWNDEIRARWETMHPQAMEWLRRTEAEAQRRGWECGVHEEERRMYERGLPTLSFKDAEHAAAMRKWVAAELERDAAGGGQREGTARAGAQTHAPLRMSVNRNNRLVQFQDAAAGKGNVLRALAELWGIAPQQVLACGDSANDYSMLDGRLGFRCGAPANADEGIKEAVRAAGGYVAEERIGLGVLEILRRFGVA
ncbi:MAG TPA: HAD family hydrolase [Chloroflexota bacterium]|nr:HAD family hydrolase [Chloroflexota bacterium]